jgi:hypothetical protein
MSSFNSLLEEFKLFGYFVNNIDNMFENDG